MFKFVTQKGCNRQELNHDYLCYKQSYYSNIEYRKQKNKRNNNNKTEFATEITGAGNIER